MDSGSVWIISTRRTNWKNFGIAARHRGKYGENIIKSELTVDNMEVVK